jgi:hypothetical protein
MQYYSKLISLLFYSACQLYSNLFFIILITFMYIISNLSFGGGVVSRFALGRTIARTLMYLHIVLSSSEP